MFDNLFKLTQLQKKLSDLKQELKNLTVDCQRQNGRISVSVNGRQEVTGLKVDSDIVSDSSWLVDLRECINEAIAKSQGLAAKKSAEITGIKIPPFTKDPD